MSGTYQDLRVWQHGMDLAAEVYRATESFPRREWYCLAGQMRRAAVSVPSNVAEGKGRKTDKDYAHFLYQARGSLLELQTQILLAEKLQYVHSSLRNALMERAAAVGRELAGLINALQPKGDSAVEVTGQRPKAKSQEHV